MLAPPWLAEQYLFKQGSSISNDYLTMYTRASFGMPARGLHDSDRGTADMDTKSNSKHDREGY